MIGRISDFGQEWGAGGSEGTGSRRHGPRARAFRPRERHDQELHASTTRTGPRARARHGGSPGMADQASLSNGAKVRINSPLVEGVVGNLADFGGNVATLAELQAKLAASELKICVRRVLIPVALTAVGFVLMLGSMPVALLGVAEWVAVAFGLTRAVSLLVTAGAAVGLAIVLAVVAYARLVRGPQCFQYSSEELSRNIAWIKTVLAQSSRATTR